jgi:DNA polymerase-3 subunit beta
VAAINPARFHGFDDVAAVLVAAFVRRDRLACGRENLPVISAEEFPVFPVISNGVAFELTTEELAQMLSRVSMSVSTDLSRHYLCGVYVHVVDERIRAVATNGHHLTYQDGHKVDRGFDGVIIPSKFVSEVVRAAPSNPSNAVFTVYAGKSVSVSWDGFLIQSKIIDGTFPDYERVIPSAPPRIAKLNADAVAVALKRAMIAADDRASTVQFAFQKNLLTLRGLGSLEAVDCVDIEYDGEPVTISLNSRYAASTLASIGGVIEVRMGDSGDHTTWQASDNNSSLTVLLPVRM